ALDRASRVAHSFGEAFSLRALDRACCRRYFSRCRSVVVIFWKWRDWPLGQNDAAQARGDHLPDAVRPCPVRDGDRWQSEGLGQSIDRPDERAGKISAAHERAWLRDRARTTRDLGQINDLFRRCVRLQVSVDDKFEQAHPVRLGWSMMSRAAFWHC